MSQAPSRENVSFFQNLQAGEMISFHMESEGRPAGVGRNGEFMRFDVMRSLSWHNNPSLRMQMVQSLADLLNGVLNLTGLELRFEEARNADGNVNKVVTQYWMSQSKTSDFDAHSAVAEMRYTVFRAGRA